MSKGLRSFVTSRRRVYSRGGTTWALTLECGHEVWRPDSAGGEHIKHARCWKSHGYHELVDGDGPPRASTL